MNIPPGAMINRDDTQTIALLSKYLFPADINIVSCVDERPDHIDSINGVEFPGGTYGIIDAIKTLTKCSGDEAWKRAQRAHIPMGAHIDNRHGIYGCGYGKLVETNPHAVLAPEAIPLVERYQRIINAEGTTPMLFGDHAPTHATINYKEGMSIDADHAVEEGLGIFNYDYWAALVFGTKLDLDPVVFANHLTNVYIRTIMTLTNNTLHTFYEIH